MYDSKEEIPTDGLPIEGTSEGASRRARAKRVKLEQFPYIIKYKYQGNRTPSKFDFEVSRITDTLVGHMDLDQLIKDTFLEDATPREKIILESRLAHVACFPIVVQCPEFILTVANAYNPTQRQCIDAQGNVIIDLTPAMIRLFFDLPPYLDVKMMTDAKALELWIEMWREIDRS